MNDKVGVSDPTDIARRTLQAQQDAAQQAAAAEKSKSPQGRMSVMRAILGECLCETFPFQESRGLSPSAQFVEMHGVESISLGAVVDELSAEQRVRETLEQLTAEPKRMLSIGYLVDDGEKKRTETVDLQVWRMNYPNDKNMSRGVVQVIKHVEAKEFGAALDCFKREYETQKAHPRRSNNKFLVGITAHNLAVLYLFSDRPEEALKMFKEALALKRAAFGDTHPQVAISLVEIGIQLFAQEKFQEAMDIFREAKRIRTKVLGSKNPMIAMILNNIACCDFVMGNNLGSLVTFQEASDIQHDALGSSARADLDLLHAAITLCNSGYMKLRLKRYEDARAVFEQALLIQQSVLADDNNRAIRDTLSNMDFTNAFHS